MSDPKNPIKGDLVIDASDVTAVDLTPEQIRRALKLRDGAPKAIKNILNLTPELIARAGLSPDAVASLGALYQDNRRAAALRGPSEKLAELMYETEIDTGHKISLLLGEMAAQARRRAERDPHGDEILAAIEELLAYQYGPAQKGVQTKKKARLEAEKAAAEAPFNS